MSAPVNRLSTPRTLTLHGVGIFLGSIDFCVLYGYYESQGKHARPASAVFRREGRNHDEAASNLPPDPK